jgi:hypothetical protein
VQLPVEPPSLLRDDEEATVCLKSTRAGQLATLTTIYREMDMRFWLEQAEAELTDLEG